MLCSWREESSVVQQAREKQSVVQLEGGKQSVVQQERGKQSVVQQERGKQSVVQQERGKQSVVQQEGGKQSVVQQDERAVEAMTAAKAPPPQDGSAIGDIKLKKNISPKARLKECRQALSHRKRKQEKKKRSKRFLL